MRCQIQFTTGYGKAFPPCTTTLDSLHLFQSQIDILKETGEVRIEEFDGAVIHVWRIDQ